MVKKIFLVLLIGAVLIAGVCWYKFLSSKTGFEGNNKFLYIHTGKANKKAVLDALEKDSIVTNIGDFEWLAEKMNYWQKIKPGKFKITKGQNLLEIVRILRNGIGSPVNLIITKLRLPEDFARLVGRNFEPDSSTVMQFLDSAGYEKYYHIIPNTYTFDWTATPDKLLNKLNNEYDKWWQKNDRIQKAETLGYSADKIYTIASIVEEETNKTEDKGNVASVYLNRLKVGMPLQADPTLRFALRDFKMNRVMNSHKAVVSPYNTYKNSGLPPGPICTPSSATIDAVLDAPKTDYVYFVAHPDLKGGSIFTTKYSDHLKWAHIYQDSLTAWLKRKAAKQLIADSLSKLPKP